MFNKPRALSVWPAQFCLSFLFLFQIFYEQIQLFLFITHTVLCRNSIHVKYKCFLQSMIVKSHLIKLALIN